MSKDLAIVQQYLSWKGHYRQYFENLLNSKHNAVYVSEISENFTNEHWIKSEFNTDKPLNIRSKIKGRFLNSYVAYKYLSDSDFQIIHLMEFEPLTYLLFSGKLRRRKLLITIHSSDRLHFSNWLSNQISGFQRFLLEIALRIASKNGSKIVTHYECHKNSIVKILGEEFRDQVTVINYPAPKPESNEVKSIGDIRTPKFLIYGQIREDKGIYEFLSDESTKRIQITIAGQIVDTRIMEFEGRENLTIIDKFLSDSEISDLINKHDYMLLPYPMEYTNGAGTFKDSLAKAMPVVCSNIPIFSEIVNRHQVGIIFNDASQIIDKVQNVSSDAYLKLSRNCLDYAYTYDWNYMKKEYYVLYESLKA